MKKFNKTVKRFILALALDRRGTDFTNGSALVTAAAMLVGGAVAATSYLNQTAASANTNQNSTTAVSSKLSGMVGATAATAATVTSPVGQ